MITHFPKEQYIVELGSNESAAMGNFKVANNEYLGYMGAFVYITNAASLVGTEKVKIGIYPDGLYQTPIFESKEHVLKTSILNLNELTAGKPHWLGFIYVEFNKETLSRELTYYARFDTSGYTKSGDLSIGVAYDSPVQPIYYIDISSGADFTKAPLAMSLLSYTL